MELCATILSDGNCHVPIRLAYRITSNASTSMLNSLTSGGRAENVVIGPLFKVITGGPMCKSTN